jgi:hypothetical protein
MREKCQPYMWGIQRSLPGIKRAPDSGKSAFRLEKGLEIRSAESQDIL